jgi:hypothetical protein
MTAFCMYQPNMVAKVMTSNHKTAFGNLYFLEDQFSGKIERERKGRDLPGTVFLNSVLNLSVQKEVC